MNQEVSSESTGNAYRQFQFMRNKRIYLLVFSTKGIMVPRRVNNRPLRLLCVPAGRPAPPAVEKKSTHNQHVLGVVQCHHFDHISAVNGDDHFFFKPGVVVLVIISRHVAARYSELARIPTCFYSPGSGF